MKEKITKIYELLNDISIFMLFIIRNVSWMMFIFYGLIGDFHNMIFAGMLVIILFLMDSNL